jgi:type I restriction enzyme M protein
MPLSTEQQARENIDNLLQDAGWIVQNRREANPSAGRGVAIREFPLKSGFGEANVLFFDRMPASEKPWTKKLWIYDLRTNQHFTLKTNTLKRADLDDLLQAIRQRAAKNAKRQAASKPFTYDELIKRDKASLDIFWLKDESLEDSANLPDPDVIAQEIVEDLQAALDEFALIAADLKK